MRFFWGKNQFKRMTETQTLKWGIASCGVISHDFANALTTLNSNEHQIVAVGARNIESAREFAKLFDIPKYYQGYENLVRDENVGK